MRKETAIKVSKAFKEFLDDKKEKGEDFETTIKRLIEWNTSVNPVNHKGLTSKPEGYIKTIKRRQTESPLNELKKIKPEMFT